MKKRQKTRTGLLLISFFLFPATYYYLSPYLIIEAGSQGIINGSFILFCLLFTGSLVLGRAYCGWLCPAAGCQEAIFLYRDKRVTRGNWIKWVIWLVWICLIVYSAIHAKGFRQIDPLYRTTHGLSIGDVFGLITYLSVLLLIAAPSFLFGKRSFCHHLCWMAPFMILGRKLRNLGGWPSLRISVDSKKCIHCAACTAHCPMSLPVEDMVQSQKMENAECILCGTCIDGCKSRVLKYAFQGK